MKKRRLSILPAAVLGAALLLGGCGRSAMPAADQASYAAAQEKAEYEEMYWAEEADEAPAEAVPMPAADDSMSIDASRENGAKLIYTAEMEIETLDFDAAVDALADLTAAVNGYFESSSLSDQGAWRWASYTVRVPAENYRVFLDKAGDGCHVLSVQEYTDDVSENYYDAAGRLETQRTKLARLQALLSGAESMEDIIALESAISETEEQIDRLSGTLRHYDALVDYSTVTVYLQEVKVYEPEPDPSFGTRMGQAFTNGLRSFSQGMQDILVALAYGWLWLLLAAAVIVVILLLTRKSRRARREERAARAEARQAVPAAYSQPAEKKPEDKT